MYPTLKEDGAFLIRSAYFLRAFMGTTSIVLYSNSYLLYCADSVEFEKRLATLCALVRNYFPEKREELKIDFSERLQTLCPACLPSRAGRFTRGGRSGQCVTEGKCLLHHHAGGDGTLLLNCVYRKSTEWGNQLNGDTCWEIN